MASMSGDGTESRGENSKFLSKIVTPQSELQLPVETGT